jgi:hypothetical protein
MSENPDPSSSLAKAISALHELEDAAPNPWLMEGALNRLGSRLMDLYASSFLPTERKKLELGAVIRRLVEEGLLDGELASSLDHLTETIEGLDYPGEDEKDALNDSITSWAQEMKDALEKSK